MTRYAEGHKEQTRAHIVDVAAKLLLEKGFDGIGIDAIMKEAGLTRGGFYGHFESKEDLETTVFARVMEATRARLFSGDAQRSEKALERVVEMYLSEKHRDSFEHGCGIPALSADVARRSDNVKKAYEAELLLLVAALEARLPSSKKGELAPFDRALALVALLAGGIAVARAVKDKALSARILAACRRFALR